MATLKVFTKPQIKLATELLSAKVATMLGRKLEEADWDFVYCNSKNIPITEWSNLNVDVNYNGLGVEHKMLRIKSQQTILSECGTTKMHPAGTRSIRIPDEEDPNAAMVSILEQYGDLIDQRTQAVKEASSDNSADMRTGWLLWKEGLDEFLYFEERMIKPHPDDYFAQWNETPARGARKASRSLWIFEKDSGRKRFSVTTSAGAKIQPYFDIPSPNEPHLYYFKVQGVKLENGLIQVWLTKSTASYLELLLGSLDTSTLSNAIEGFKNVQGQHIPLNSLATAIATPVYVTESAYNRIRAIYEPVSDEYVFQQFAFDLGVAS